MQHSALTVCKQMVSGSISFPSRGAFHLSLTVLVHYRSAGYLALESGLPSFPPGSSCPAVLKNTGNTVFPLSTTGLSPFAVGLSRARSSREKFCNCASSVLSLDLCLTTPLAQCCTLVRARGLGFSRFVRHYYGNSIFSSGYLDVSVPPLAPSFEVLPITVEGCPIRKSSDRTVSVSPKLIAA